MDLGPVLFPLAPELGVMSRWAPSLVWERLRGPSLVWERLRGPSLVWERLREPSWDVTLEPEAVRDLIRRVMLAEGTGRTEDGWLRDARWLLGTHHMHLTTSHQAFLPFYPSSVLQQSDPGSCFCPLIGDTEAQIGEGLIASDLSLNCGVTLNSATSLIAM